MKRSVLKRLSVSALALAMTLSVLPAVPASADGLDCVFVTRESDGRQIWFENNVQQGTLEDAKGILGFGTNRGREIFDPATNEWYWLDAFRTDDPNQISYDGAKAVGKEVWIPYVYQDELADSSDGYGRFAQGITDEAKITELAGYSIFPGVDMSAQVADAIRNHSGKWVRYDENGAMMKGWVTIDDTLAQYYPDQKGNQYYYDQKTGLMAKGWLLINGVYCHFDEVTGVLTESYAIDVGTKHKTLCEVSAETVYATPREGDRDYKTVYIYGDAEHPTSYSASENYTKINGEYVKTGESQYKTFSYQEGNSTYTSNRQVSSKRWTFDEESNQLYLSSEGTYEYDLTNLSSYNYTRQEYTNYRPNGDKYSYDLDEYSYDANGNRTKYISTYLYYNNGEVSSTYKSETVYTFNDKNQQVESVTTSKATKEGEKDRPQNRTVYHYDENGNQVGYDSYYYGSSWDSEKQEYVEGWQLSGVYKYTYEQIDGTWKTKLYERFDVSSDGVVAEQAEYKTEYFYENGKQSKTESYELSNGEYVLTSRSEYRYDNEGYRVYYRSYRSNSSYDSTTGTYKYDDLAFEYGYDEFYENIPDPSYTKGYRHAETQEIYYRGVDADGREVVDYYVLYDTGFSWNVGDLEVGATKDRNTRYYNADGSDYYTYTETYVVKEY